jgi:hypothetical protein
MFFQKPGLVAKLLVKMKLNFLISCLFSVNVLDEYCSIPMNTFAKLLKRNVGTNLARLGGKYQPWCPKIYYNAAASTEVNMPLFLKITFR